MKTKSHLIENRRDMKGTKYVQADSNLAPKIGNVVTIFVVAFLLLLGAWQPAGAQIILPGGYTPSFGTTLAKVGKDTITYNHRDLITKRRKKLVVGKKPASYYTNCDEEIDKATLTAKLSLGKDYTFGKAGFYTGVKLKIKSFDASSALVNQWIIDTLMLTESTPEQCWQVDYTSTFNQVKYFRVIILVYQKNMMVKDSVQLQVFVNVKYKIKPESLTSPTATMITQNTVASGAPKLFSWSCDCDFPSYQLQLMRLYNTNHAKNNENDITANVDWSQALSVEVRDTSIEMNLGEGKGIYIWRNGAF